MSTPKIDIDIGLAILCSDPAHKWHVKEVRPFLRRPGGKSHREIAAFLGCSWGNVWLIEQRGIHKLRRALSMRKDPVLAELLETWFSK